MQLRIPRIDADTLRARARRAQEKKFAQEQQEAYIVEVQARISAATRYR